jgi:hypothetical protein
MALEGRDGNKSVFQSLFTQTLTDLQAVFQGYLSHSLTRVGLIDLQL